MNIKKENTDELNAVLTVRIEKADYDERVENVLADYRKKARLDGFRPGKVPMGLVRKMYRKAVLVDEVNKILGESVAKYFSEEKLYIIGEPLPHEDDSAEFDWDNDSEFEFSFDIGLAPEVDVTVTEKDKIPYYSIKIDDELRNQQIDQLKSRYGSLAEVDKISGNEVVKADLDEVDKDRKPLEGGLHVENGTFSVESIQDKKVRGQFTGCKPGDKLIIDIKKAFPNETDLAALLHVDKEKLPEAGNFFQVTLRSLSLFNQAEISQELFDKAYGKGVVSSEEEFRKKIDEELEFSFKRESEYRFNQDARNAYLKKFKQEIPDKFYKRWLLHVNEGNMSSEQLEENYDNYVNDLKWQLIKAKIIQDNSLTVSEEELVSHVIELFRIQFMQYYGMANVPPESLEKYAREALTKEDERRRYHEMVMENKVFEFIRKTVKRDNKDVTLDKFNALDSK